MSALRPYAHVRSQLSIISSTVHAFLSSDGWAARAQELRTLAEYCEARASDALVRELADSLAMLPGQRPSAPGADAVPPREPPHLRARGGHGAGNKQREEA